MGGYKRFLFCAFIGVLAVVGCSEKRVPIEGQPTKVIIWDFGGLPGYQAWVKEAVAEYNRTHSHIQIELEIKDWATQRESLISTTIMGEGPDIIRVHHKYSVEFGELGGLYALENFADFSQVRQRFLDNVWEHVEFDGKHYGLPLTMLPFVLAVNKEIMAANNLEVPRTWEEMEALGPKLAAKGIHAFTMPGGVNLDTAYRFLPMLYKGGGRVFNEDWSRAAFNGPAGVEALRFLLRMKGAGFFPSASAAYAFDENCAHWSTGKAALSIEGPWWQEAVSSNYGFNLDKLALAPIPAPDQPLEDNPSRTLLDVIMVAITGYTPVPEQTWEVLKALYVDHPIWQVPYPPLGGIPTQVAALEPGVKSEYISLDVLATAGRNGLGWPGHPAITQIQRHIADAVNMALSGVMDPQEALDAAAEEVDEILDEF